MAEINMDSTSSVDIYSETIDYIKQIEKEIVFSLDDSHLELGDSLTSKDINTYCDILLDKISKELYITSNLEKDDEFNSSYLTLNQRAATNNNNNHFEDAHQRNSPTTFTEANAHKQTLPLHKNGTDFGGNIDKINNYRYSFYDNSNTISICIASSSLIDYMEKDHSKYVLEENEPNKICIFGCHPGSIQRNSQGFILPPFIESALVYLTKFGQTSVGIFRKSGVKSRINALKNQIENQEKIEFDSLCVYDVADLVKTWLRDLKPHLISQQLIDCFTKSKESFSLWQLSDSHRYLVLVVLQFLSNISSHSKHNQMTAHNLAICFAPSLCDCETEQQMILNAQKCLEYCIENVESLFYMTAKVSVAKIPVVLNRHTSTAIINASPQDILHRVLYERNTIDPLISEWSIRDSTKNGDTFELNVQFSSFLPTKSFVFKRKWTISDSTILVDESAEFYCSMWHLKANGQGQTQVIHELELDFRGFSRKWYETTFAVIHNDQLKRLTSSFECIQPQLDAAQLLISDV